MPELAQQLIGGIVGIDGDDAEHPLGLLVVRRERGRPVLQPGPLRIGVEAPGRAVERVRVAERAAADSATRDDGDVPEDRQPEDPAQPELRRAEVAPQVPGRARHVGVGEAAPALDHADAVALLGQPQRGDAAAEARADDEPVVVEILTHCQQSIRAAGRSTPPRASRASPRRRARARGSRARARPPSRARGGRTPRARARRRRRCRPRSATQASSSASSPGRSGTRREHDEPPARQRLVAAGDREQEAGVDVAAGQDRHRRAARRGRDRAAQQRGDADRAGALDDELAALEQHHHRLGGVLVLDDDLPPRATRPQQRERELAGLLDGDAVRDREAGLGDRLAQRRERRARGDLRRPPRRPARRLHRDGDARGQPAAADRDDDLREVGHVLEQLEAERALAGDDVGSSNGWTNTIPLSRARSCAAARHSSILAPPMWTVAPWPRVASALAIGASAGTKTSHGTPSAAAAAATPCAWLPAEAATTPPRSAPSRRRRASRSRRGP